MRGAVASPFTIDVVGQRSYVSESRRDHAQVNMEATVRAEQQAFNVQTGLAPQSVPIAGTEIGADAMLSPQAGT